MGGHRIACHKARESMHCAQAAGAALVSGARTVRIVFINHEAAQAAALAGLLERPEFRVTVLSSLEEARFEDIAVFDGVVLGTQGTDEKRAELCRTLRDEGYAGAVLAVCAEVTEVEVLLEAGADDFVTARFEPRELVARIDAVVRRATSRSRLRWGPLELDRVHRILRLPGGTTTLTDRECELLACLIEARGLVVSRANLREWVWQSKEDRGTNLGRTPR
jgi:DNA-binding response OmpR family regulator